MAEEAAKLRELTTREKEIQSIKEKNSALDEKGIALQEKKLNLEQQYGDTIKDGRTNASKMYKSSKQQLDVVERTKDTNSDLSKILEDNANFVDITNLSAKKLGDSIEGAIDSIPFVGETLKRNMGLEDFGDKLEGAAMKSIKRSLQQGKSATQTIKGLGKAVVGTIRGLLGPLGLALVGFTAIFTIIRGIRKANRDLANQLGIQTSEAAKFQVSLKASEMAFKAMGLDGSQLKNTMKSIGQEFGSLENMTVANARNIERFAQNSGIAGSEVVKLNKVFMDLDGLSFDAATNVSKVAADLAKAAGVSTAKVIGDMASNAADFARFSMDGAAGMAKAAVEAAKVGSSLSEILKSADTLIDFESSITKQFEAQVLTGKMINTERARQLALDGDIAGLTTEIQSIVGGVGDIQSLNVIQRKSVAEAIGISVADLLRISRGEQAQQQETVQDKLTTTNKLLAAQDGDRKAILEATINNKDINIREGVY